LNKASSEEEVCKFSKQNDVAQVVFPKLGPKEKLCIACFFSSIHWIFIKMRFFEKWLVFLFSPKNEELIKII